jgi:hypothetical protein
MFNHFDLCSLGDRMEKLETALFFNDSAALTRFPTSLARIVDRDDLGGVWFSLKRKYSDMSGFDREFPGQLHFYNRLFNYWMEVEGIASIVTVGVEVFIRFQVSKGRCMYYKGDENKHLTLSLPGHERREKIA